VFEFETGNALTVYQVYTRCRGEGLARRYDPVN